jgi:hypothetical protein
LTVESIRTLKERADRADARADKAEAKLADVLDRVDAIERGNPHAPKIIGFNAPTGVGVFGIIVGGIALLSARRKKDEKSS